MKVLVTGGSGTIGGYVLRELRNAGHGVSSYSRSAPLVEEIRHIQGNILDLDRLIAAYQNHEAVVHLAAVPGPQRASPTQLMSVNLVGTVNVLEAAVQANVEKVVFASSDAAMGFAFQTRPITPQYLPLDEEHPCEPHDEYGLSKLLGELICKRYSDAYGLQTICLRIHHNWYVDRNGASVAVRSGWARGLTVEELWTRRYQHVIENPESEWKPLAPPSPRNMLWAFTDARDAAHAFRLAVENTDLIHEVFLISGSDTCSTIQTSELILRYFPNVPLETSLSGYASLWSHKKATCLLGYRPQYTWRSSDFQNWMDRQ